MAPSVAALVDHVRSTDPSHAEFHQAAEEVLESIVPVANADSEIVSQSIVERLLEPDRVIRFRVTWEDDEGGIHVNRGWRVQHSNALGPYKGGLRFHPTVNLGVLRFLAFEQAFKNALTGLPLGAGKGGSDFDPKGKSDREVMRFCQSFMNELWRHIGAETDVPAGDIGVGGREVGFLTGQFRRLSVQWTGVMTGKSIAGGGIEMRTEATGYGSVFFAENAMEHVRGESLEGKRALISGSGNVALFAAQKLLALGAGVHSLSDSKGSLRIDEGLTKETLQTVKRIKFEQRQSLAAAADAIDGAEFLEGKTPWHLDGDLAFPCATQNELGEDDAKALAGNGALMVVEGANMPCTKEAMAVFHREGVIVCPGKAANAGGVAVSGLEMAQNAGKHPWSRERVAEELRGIMKRIHQACADEDTSAKGDPVDYVRAANVAGFRRVAAAMLASGVS